MSGWIRVIQPLIYCLTNGQPLADDILNLLDLADRQLASSRFDTRLSPPTGRAVPRAQP